MRFPVATFCLASLLLGGCGTVVVRETPQPVRVADGTCIDTVPLAEAFLSRTGTVAQAVSGSWKENVFSAEVVMKGDGGKFTAVFLAPHMRLATITISRPHSIRYERASQIPRMLEPEYVLADLAFANLDADTLRRATGPALRIDESADGTRRIFAGPEPVAELKANPDGTRTFRNNVHGYEYTLRNIPLR